jgi:hypothetical protein
VAVAVGARAAAVVVVATAVARRAAAAIVRVANAHQDVRPSGV